MKLLYGSIVFIAIACFAPLAFGQNLAAWKNTTTSQSFDDGTNWVTSNGPNIVPDSTYLTGIFPGFTAATGGTSGGIVLTQGGSNNITISTPNDQSVEGLLVSGDFDGQQIGSSIVNLNFNGGSTLTVGDLGMAVTGTTTTNYVGGLQMSSGDLVVGSTDVILDPSQTTGSGILNLSSGTVNLDSNQQTDFVVGDGTTGTVTQKMDSVVTTGELFTLGIDGGTATYSLTNNSILNIGTLNNPLSGSYLPGLGEGAGSTGTLNIGDTSTLNATNDGTLFQVGTGSGTTGGVGIINQMGTSTVNMGGTSLTLGENGGTGTYNLMSGNLNITNSETMLGEGADSTGTLTQTGGTLTVGASTTFTIGDGGTGIYTLSGGTAEFENGFVVGDNGSTGTITQSGTTTLTVDGGTVTIGAAGTGNYNLQGGSADFQSGFTIGTGTVTQSGPSTLTAENNVVTIGSSGTGVYNLQSGTATFNAGVLVGATGSVNQSGGTFTIPLGQTLDLSTVGSSYTLSGGTLQVGYDGVTNGLTGTTGEGTLNFAGGTLQPNLGSSSPLIDALDGTVTGNSKLDTTNADITLSGSLTGTGTLTVIGGGTVDLTGANHSAGWGITISNGTVDADASTFPSVGNISIGSNGAGATGTLNLTVANGVNILTGNLTSTGSQGTAQLNVNFGAPTDTLELGGTNKYTATITRNGGGTLRVFNGTYGDIEDNNTNSNVEIGGDTNIAQTGTVTLAGPNNYLGDTKIDDGFTLIASNLPGTVTNLGTLSTGLTPSTLPNTGNTTFMAGGATLSESNTPTMNIGGALTSTNNILANTNGVTSDLYVVSPTAGSSTVSGTITVHGVGTVVNQVIVDAQGGLVDNGVTANVTGSHVLFNGTITQIDDYLVLNTTQLGTASFALTPNQRAVASAIDPILTSTSPPAGFTRLGVYYNNLTAAEIPEALDMNSPEKLQYSRMIAFENSTFLAQRVDGFLSDVRNGYTGWDTNGLSVIDPVMNSGLGRSMGSLLALNSPYHQPAPNGVNYYPEDDSAPTAAAPDSPISSGSMSDSENPLMVPASHPASSTYVPPSSVYTGPTMTEFIGGDIILADLNQNPGSSADSPSSKASYTAGDATAGIAFRMTSNLSAGVLFDYNHTDANVDSNGSKTTVDSYSPGIFATYYDHGFYVNGLASFGWNTYSNDINLSSLGTAHSSPNGQQYVGNLDFGYDFQPDRHWILGPTLGLIYTHLDVDSFTESGAPGADLNVHSQSADSLRSRLGGHVIYQAHTGSILLQPNFTLMWQHEYLDNSSGITSQFSDFASTPFTIQTAAPSRDSALIGCGITATLDSSVSLYLNYMADVGASDYFAQTVMGGLKARF